MADLFSPGASSIFPLAIGFTVLLLLADYLTRYWKQKTSRLPPGPNGWPFLGFMKYIFSETPEVVLTDAKKKYGNIFGFYVGRQYCVILSDFPSVKEAFSRKAFLSRPPKSLRTSPDHKNFGEMDGVHWDIHRKFIANTFREVGVGTSRFEEILHDEISRAVARMENYVGKSKCDLRELISPAINNVVIQIICSRWFEPDHPFMTSFTRFQKMTAESFSNNMAYIYFPWLDWCLNKFHPHYKAIGETCSEMADFIRSEVQNRLKIHNESSNNDYIDMYLNEVKSGKHDPEFFGLDNLVHNSALLLMGGSDTTRNSLEWLLMSMAHFPDIQEKIYYEIVSVVGTERPPSCADKSKLPYTEATVFESQRWKTLAPLNVLRWTNEDAVVSGYTVPKNTVVINNLYFCHNDPSYWKSPEKFDPDRFLSKDKSRVVVPEYFIPFSLGRRNCPGDKVAAIEIFVYFTVIIQKFKLFPPKGGVDFEGSTRINYQAVRPFVRLERR